MRQVGCGRRLGPTRLSKNIPSCMNCTTSTCHHVGGDEDSKQIGFWMVGGMSCGCNCCLAVTYIWMKHRQMYDRIHSYADTVSNRLSQRPLFSDMDAFDKDMCERLDQLELLISTHLRDVFGFFIRSFLK